MWRSFTSKFHDDAADMVVLSVVRVILVTVFGFVAASIGVPPYLLKENQSFHLKKKQQEEKMNINTSSSSSQDQGQQPLLTSVEVKQGLETKVSLSPISLSLSQFFLL
jgi:hypothetical protein